MSYNTWMPPGYPQQPQFPPMWQPQRPDMVQGYPQSQQIAPAQPQSQQQAFATRPVTSREEAVAVQVDFMGAGTLMPDLSHGAIYLKRFNQETGACDFMTFTAEQAKPETPAAPAGEYATKADLQEMQQVIQGLAGDIERLRERGGKRIANE